MDGRDIIKDRKVLCEACDNDAYYRRFKERGKKRRIWRKNGMNSSIKEKYATKAEALQILFKKCCPEKQVEMVPLSEAINRVLAKTLESCNTLPVVRASMMDGIAVSSELFKDSMPDATGWEAGREYSRVDTGDDFDDKYDAVIAIEKVLIDEDDRLQFREELSVKPGDCVKKSGSTIKKGDYIISAGVPIRPSDLAALALGGIAKVPVYKKPVVVFIPTGSELVLAGKTPQRGENIDSNSMMAKHMLLEMGAEPVCYPIVKDDPKEIKIALEKALEQGDIVIMNGGSSKGAEDFTSKAINKNGAAFLHGVAAGPGRPMSMAVINGKPVINLPGPVAAAYYGLEWCIRALVNQYLGLPMIKRQRVTAILTEDMQCPKFISFLCKVNVQKTAAGIYTATPIPFKVASIGMCLSTNGQFISEIGEAVYKKGDSIEVELLRGEEFI